MSHEEFLRLKNKIMLANQSKYWGDDFDVRYYVISRLKDLKNQIILDAGGGIGIISSEIDATNLCMNLDQNYLDLKICHTKMSTSVQNVNGILTELPFNESKFDYIVSCHALDSGKMIDRSHNNVILNNGIPTYPTIEKTLTEFKRILKTGGKLILTFPNNRYYKTTALEYEELENIMSKIFPRHSIYCFNTFPKLGKNRKTDLANVIPKIFSKIMGRKFILEHLIRYDKRKSHYSVSFYVEATKD